MKIHCDVCHKAEASSFCPADDAALCTKCDHHANTVAGTHDRFSLLPPSSPPMCDICQEHKALMFCQQDRAILCKDCDLVIHKVNEHTRNHSRFVLTGVKLSPVVLQLSPATGHGGGKNRKADIGDHQEPAPEEVNCQGVPEGCRESASSISEYLIETLPGWQVEDLLDHSPPTSSKVNDEDSWKFWDDDLLKGSMNNRFSSETMGNWVPQAPPPAIPPLPTAPPTRSFLHNNPYKQQSFSNMGFGSQLMINWLSPYSTPDNNKITKSNGKREYEEPNCFTVPQIDDTLMTTFKRSRTIRY